MQDLNNHIDDLFRKAAADYPLRQNQDNWEKVAPLLKGSILLDPAPKTYRSRGFNASARLLFAAVFLSVLMPIGNPTKNIQTAKPYENIIEKIAPAETYFTTSAKKRQQHKVSHQNPLPITVESETEQDLHPAIVSPILINPQQPALSVTVKTPQFNPQKISPAKKRHIYLGLAFGPSLNQVKNQGLQKTGYDIGFIAGYQLTKRLAIETGITYAKKYYFSDGKYFNMSGAGSGMPSGMKILAVEGSSDVFEIPLKLKYDLKTRKDNHVYFSAGISTYILTGEYNKYKAFINGAAQNIKSKYGSNKNYAAAAINYSIGYEIKLGKTSQVRIEPYMQIPLKGVGIGSLPVTTAGLHLGITKKIF